MYRWLPRPFDLSELAALRSDVEVAKLHDPHLVPARPAWESTIVRLAKSMRSMIFSPKQRPLASAIPESRFRSINSLRAPFCPSARREAIAPAADHP